MRMGKAHETKRGYHWPDVATPGAAVCIPDVFHACNVTGAYIAWRGGESRKCEHCKGNGGKMDVSVELAKRRRPMIT
jgi:hypothetical protein